ncbi:hypothetical protein A2U01_0098751, partial [Trifolium medium]|nr:hypothetical protein [Trifolium medium]
PHNIEKGCNGLVQELTSRIDRLLGGIMPPLYGAFYCFTTPAEDESSTRGDRPKGG